MLWYSAILSAAMLAVVCATLYRREKHRSLQVLGALGLGFAPVLMGCFFPCATIQGLLLAGLSAADKFRGFSARTYLTLAIALTVLPYVLMGLVQWYSLNSLQQQFPYESVEARLPTPRHAAGPNVKPADEKNVAILEVHLDEQINSSRGRILAKLHENAVAAFVNSPGFGQARMSGNAASEAALQIEMEEESTHLQPFPRGSEAVSPGDPGLPIAGTAQPFLQYLHQDSVLDFVYPEGFGYFKDRRHVAGFRPHQFRKLPAPANSWRVQSLELVGLVVHDEPAVYVSDLLPRMDVLRKAPVRSPNAFEALGLVELTAGETLFVRVDGERLRVLGAIRATKQCVACHDCERGDLLGAFSYVLRKQ